MKALLLWMIRFYRREISPLRPPCCRFIPTCSQYALEAVEKYGAVEGGLAGAAPHSAVQPLPPAEIHPVRSRAVMEVRNQFNNVEVPLWVFC